ncbi:MAG: UvrB/UvrC motif-containing protein [Parachlamydiaceae bacterium]
MSSDLGGEEPENNDDEEILPERPLECSECKKQISVCYTEIVEGNITRTSMCADCPELHRRLYGNPSRRTDILEEVAAGLTCGNCGTTLESLRVGIPLGCSGCYEVFDDALLVEIIASEKVPIRLTTVKKSGPIHIGRVPGQTQKINPSLRLLALNEALNETLKKEDYEQAALLRDQIKAISEYQEGSDELK